MRKHRLFCFSIEYPTKLCTKRICGARSTNCEKARGDFVSPWEKVKSPANIAGSPGLSTAMHGLQNREAVGESKIRRAKEFGVSRETVYQYLRVEMRAPDPGDTE